MKTQCLEKSDRLAEVLRKVSSMNATIQQLKGRVVKEFNQVIRTVIRSSV